MAGTTRLGLSALPAQPYGSFAGRAAEVATKIAFLEALCHTGAVLDALVYVQVEEALVHEGQQLDSEALTP